MRAEHDSDISSFIADVAKENLITTASFTGVGALKWAKLGFYDQQKHEYSEELLVALRKLLVASAIFPLRMVPLLYVHTRF